MAEGGDAGANIMVRVLKADGVRMHNDKKPFVLAQLRINVGGLGEQPHRTTAIEGTSNEWNQQFVLPVSQPPQSQLECTLWDDSDADAENNGNFLGEVILNLAKLVPYNGQYIEQVFDIKQGKTIVTPQKASGKLKLGLQINIPEPGTAPEVAAAAPAAPVPPSSGGSSAPAPPAPPSAPKAPSPPPSSGAVPPPDSDTGAVRPSQLRKQGSGRVGADPDPKPSSTPPPPAPGQATVAVTVVECQNLPKTEAAFGAVPDPFVVVELMKTGPPILGRSNTVRKDQSPKFDPTEMVFGLDNEAVAVAEIVVTVLDWNRGKEELIGRSMVKVLDVARNGLLEPLLELRDPRRGNAPTGAKVRLAMAFTGTRGPAPVASPPAPAAPRAPATPGDMPLPPRPQAAPPQEEGSPMGGPRVLQGRKAPAQPALPAGGGPADVGFVLAQGPGRGLVVQAVLPGGPAASSGQIRPGDLLIDVDGHDVVAPRPVRPTNPPFCILPFVSPILS